MASASRPGELVLSIEDMTLRGTVAGTTVNCRVRLGAGLGARLAAGEYRFSPPMEHPTVGTVACATLISTGSSGGPQAGGFASAASRGLAGGLRKPESPPTQRGGADSVMFHPDPVQIEKSVLWGSGSEGGPAKGETDVLTWTGIGRTSRLVFAARSAGGWNNVAVLTGFDPLIRALTLSAGCPLIVCR